MKRSLFAMAETIGIIICCAVIASMGRAEEGRFIFTSALICAVLAECIANRREEGK